MSFKFRLEKIHHLREQQETQEKQNLGRVLASAEEARRKLVQLRNDLESHQARTIKQADAFLLQHHHNMAQRLRRQILEQIQVIAQIDQDVERQRRLLARKTTQRKSLDAVKQKRRQEWDERQNRRETAFLDEVASRSAFL